VKTGDITLFINPKQDELLHELLPALQAVYPVAQHARIEQDPAVAPGGCRIITADGEVDTTIDTQLDRLIDEVLPKGDD
jgi:flagellar biosynthesis/type III secretory pathway protein FliH